MDYWAHGAIHSMQLGNGLTESTGYRSRLQPEVLTLGNVARLDYTYWGNDSTKNNGNVITQKITVGSDTMRQE